MIYLKVSLHDVPCLAGQALQHRSIPSIKQRWGTAAAATDCRLPPLPCGGNRRPRPVSLTSWGAGCSVGWCSSAAFASVPAAAAAVAVAVVVAAGVVKAGETSHEVRIQIWIAVVPRDGNGCDACSCLMCLHANGHGLKQKTYAYATYISQAC